MSDQASVTTAMLGLSGFMLPSISRLGSELVQTIETTESGVGCTGCGTPARLHDRRAIRVLICRRLGDRRCWCGAAPSRRARSERGPGSRGKSGRGRC